MPTHGPPVGGNSDIGNFEKLKLLGAGGFGEVYACRLGHAPEQLAAVKELMCSIDQRDSPERTHREVASLQRITSAFMPAFLENGYTERHDGNFVRLYPWIATELIAGLPLGQIISACGPLPEETVWQFGAGMVTAIADIHRTNRMHRDLKPDNVLMAINGPWVIDLGLAGLMDTEPLWTSRSSPMGPGEYGSPEWQEGGLPATGRPADIYGLGAVLLLALTEHGPYPGYVGPQQVLSSPPDLEGLPAGPLGELVKECLSRKEADRPKVRELQRTFGSLTDGAIRAAFPGVLPAPVESMLAEHLRWLAVIAGTWGPAELGWGPDLREPIRGRRKRPNPSPSKPTSPWPVAWTGHVEGWIRGPLAVHGDMVVVASLDGSVAALSTRDGTPHAAWAGPVRTGAALHAGPLIIPAGPRGTAYVGDADGIVHGIDLGSGRDDVVLEAGAAIEGTPVTIRGSVPGAGGAAVMEDRLYALTFEGELHYINLRAGQPMVLHRMGRPATGPLATRSGWIFVATGDGVMSAINAINGEQDWSLPTDGQVLAAPLELGFWLYVCGTDGVLRQVAIEDGREAATVKVGSAVHCAPVGDAYRVYLAGADSRIRAYDVSEPNRERLDDPLWERDVDHEVAGIAVTPTRVYVSAGHRLMELDVATGKLTREPFPLKSLIGAAPVISGGNCYVGSLDGVVTCLSL